MKLSVNFMNTIFFDINNLFYTCITTPPFWHPSDIIAELLEKELKNFVSLPFKSYFTHII